MPRLIKRKDNYFIRQGGLYYQDVELKAGIIVMNYRRMKFMPAESETPQENIHNIQFQAGVQMKCRFYF
jgi:hypothetical protein